MTATLAEKMDGLSSQFLTGLITQEELLRAQRELLNAPLPDAQPVTPQSIELSSQTRCEEIIAGLQAKKANAAAVLAEIRDKQKVLALEKDKLSGAIASAEAKTRIISGSGGVYREERARAIAAGRRGVVSDNGK